MTEQLTSFPKKLSITWKPPQQEHKFTNAFYMEPQIKDVEETQELQTRGKLNINLVFGIHDYGDNHDPLRFALTGGCLCLSLTNAILPHEKAGLYEEIALEKSRTVVNKMVESSSLSQGSSANGSLGVSATPKAPDAKLEASMKGNADRSTKYEKTTSIDETHTEKVYRHPRRGSNKITEWEFSATDDSLSTSYWEGSIIDLFLGNFSKDSVDRYSLDFSFKIYPKNIRVVEEGRRFKNIPLGKQQAINWFIEKKLCPSDGVISKVKLEEL